MEDWCTLKKLLNKLRGNSVGQLILLYANDVFLMMKNRKIFLITVFICTMAMPAFAQGYHFIYIQADARQPFYLKYNGKNYSSTSVGYLILPKLSDGDFTVQVGFPKNLYSEQTFNLSVSGKDYGYALKNFADKGWGLFNFQTTDIVMNVNGAATQTAATVTTNKSNPFGNMLADAIDDSTLNQQRNLPESSSAKSPSSAVVKDTPVAANAAAATPAYSTQYSVDSLVKVYTNGDNTPSNKVATDTAKSIVKSAENATSGGTDITFLDKTSKDTIHAFIPSADTNSTEQKAATADTAKSKSGNPFFNNTNNTTTQQPAFVDTTTSTGITASAVTNSNCQKMISSYDIDKLRKKIAKSDSQNDILEAIKKALRDKCLTTEQVKDFSGLFSSDENRCNFYDAVYPFVSDYFNFPQLENTLIDTYYKSRFKALIH